MVWVADLSGEVSLSADAVAIVENDFDQVASELRTAAAERLADSGLAWEFRWRQGLIAHELTAAARRFRPPGPTTWWSSWSAAHPAPCTG